MKETTLALYNEHYNLAKRKRGKYSAVIAWEAYGQLSAYLNVIVQMAAIGAVSYYFNGTFNVSAGLFVLWFIGLAVYHGIRMVLAHRDYVASDHAQERDYIPTSQSFII